LQAGDEIALRGFHGEVVVIAHNNIGLEQPPGAFTCREKTFLKSLPGPGGCEKESVIVAPIDDVIDRSRVLKSSLRAMPQHPAHASTDRTCRRY
jgi:hypothetical protein